MTVAGSDCRTGKQQFTREAAADRRDYWRRRGDRAMRAYRCVFCDCWHVGHLDRAEKKLAKVGR